MAVGRCCLIIFIAGCCALSEAQAADVEIGGYDPRYGTYVGAFNTLFHDVSGEVYAVDNITIHIRNFNYDGEGPDAYFFAGNRSPKPTNRGFVIPNEQNSNEVLGPYRNRNFVLKFPITPKGQRGFFDIKWLSVWCIQHHMDFGHVILPEVLQTPAPVIADGVFSSDTPALSSGRIVHQDANTILIEDFTYDGSVEDAIFVFGSGDENASGAQLPDEKGGLAPLRKYKRETLYLYLPKEARDSSVQYVGVWSPTENMITSVTFPPDSRVPPSPDTLL